MTTVDASTIKRTIVTIDGEVYQIKPLNVARAAQALQLTLKYLGRSGDIVRILIEFTGSGKNPVDGVGELLRELTFVAADEEFSSDLLHFLHVLSGIPIPTLAEADAVEIAELLPEIVTASRYIDVLSRSISKAVANIQQQRQTDDVADEDDMADTAPSDSPGSPPATVPTPVRPVAVAGVIKAT